MTEQNEGLDLSFTTPIRGPLAPESFELDAYFPGKRFWTVTVSEHYELNDQQEEELQSKGWEPLNMTMAPSELLPFTSQLHPLLGVRKPGQDQTHIIIWVRSVDLQYAKEYPVILVYETDEKIPKGRVVVGTQALILERETVYRYMLEDLGEEGQRLWTNIVKGLQEGQFHAKTLRANKASERADLQQTLSKFEEDYTAYLRKTYGHFPVACTTASCNAAASLAKQYWLHHQQHPGTAIRLPRSLDDIPQAFRKRKLQSSLIPATHGLEAALLAMSNAAEGAYQWKNIKNQPTYVHEKEQSTAAVTVSPTGITEQLWQRINTYSDLDGDVLLAMIAQATTGEPDERGAVWITVENILSHRGIAQNTHKTTTSIRTAGYHPAKVREVAECVERLRNTHVTVRTLQLPRKPGGRTRRVKQESYLVLISDFLVPEHTAKKQEAAIAWYYRPGDCLGVSLGKKAQRKAAWLLQQILHYDPYHEKWEKRLGRYFMFHLRLGTSGFGGSTIHRSIGTMLREVSLDINKNDPGKTAARFEEAMRTLQDHGHISGWNQERYFEMMQQRPVRNWLDQWLSYELEISASPLSEELSDELMDTFHQRLEQSSEEKE